MSGQTVEDHFEQIGERLRKARENAGLEVDDVVFKTRLPRSAIEALEAEDFSHFTSPVYAKSFLAQYAGFLNVDATPWLDALKPSAFIEGDPLLPLLESSGTMANDSLPADGTRGGWTSTLWLLALSCGIVFGVVRAFEFFESRFGGDITNQFQNWKPANKRTMEKAPEPAAPPASQAAPDLPKKEEEAFHPAPRAIIVR
ncbi:MAG: helix-turn-helix domain-containing protein [Luteolibacter sp.]